MKRKNIIRLLGGLVLSTGLVTGVSSPCQMTVQAAPATATPAPSALADVCVNPISPAPEAIQVRAGVPGIADEATCEALAKTVFGEARSLTKTEQAAVVWCILNRLDDGRFGDSIMDVVTAPNQFTGYRENNPVSADIMALVQDVLSRYARENTGATDVGRVLPSDYLFFHGDGEANHFRKEYKKSGIFWDWSLESPYQEGGQAA